jgi:hypothetical protein
MSLFDRFRKRKEKPKTAPPDPASLPSLSYVVAYFILPHYAFQQCDKLVSMFRDTPESTGPFFYFMGCQMEKTAPVEEDGRQFRAHHGALDESQDYYLLEYPVPPPVDLSGIDPAKFDPEQMPVLAPWFSAMVRQRVAGTVRYFVLGQSPIGGGTTFRSVSADGMNANHGPGPEPRLDAFLDRIRMES